MTGLLPDDMCRFVPRKPLPLRDVWVGPHRREIGIQTVRPARNCLGADVDAITRVPLVGEGFHCVPRGLRKARRLGNRLRLHLRGKA